MKKFVKIYCKREKGATEKEKDNDVNSNDIHSKIEIKPVEN